ncbi:hypothetical protein predicted by Glimmer/Critica [Sorangium cellulosum So ce56]|uniref:Uncharacterized protein n=1 Tax=Sorangium cellulosum (strain So ce56) TaxID=448385 RepID=A9GM57_SORC5|nr:hypothetical protein predicted by Glimmer/Critica [Sorangium cellulosum So ce56]
MQQSNEVSDRAPRGNDGFDPADRFTFALDDKYVPMRTDALEYIRKRLRGLSRGNVGRHAAHGTRSGPSDNPPGAGPRFDGSAHA